MKTERVFLMELFLEEKLPREIKILIKNRFQELDEPTQRERTENLSPLAHMYSEESAIAKQSPSMQKLMQQNPDLIPKPPVPVTPAAAQALAARQALLNSAGKEKPENGRTSPRKS